MEPNLFLRNVTIGFNREILNEVSYEFESGNVYLLQGDSGIGKSSLLNVIGLLKRPYSGEVVYNNQNLWSMKDTERTHIRLIDYGFIFQSHNLISSLTLEENLKVPLLKSDLSEEQKKIRVTSILNKLGLEKQRHMLPENLSGGEDQRGAIGRALISGARIILADEPTNSLDEKNARKFYEQLSELAHQQQAIVIVASHEDLPKTYADKIVTISGAKLKEKPKHKHANTLPRGSYSTEVPASRVKYATSLSNKKAITYDRYQSTNKLSMGLLAVIIIMLAVASLILNAPQILASQQQHELSQATDNSLFITNNTLRTGGEQDLDPFRNFTKKQIGEIKKISGVASLHPYFNFLSYGLTKENVRQPVPKGSSFSFGTKQYHADNTFSIQPIYKSDLTKQYFFAQGKSVRNGKNS